MAKGEKEAKAVKDLGWDRLHLSTTIGLKGAIQTYKSDSGSSVAVVFNYHDAFVVEDDQGLFGVDDLEQGIIKAKSIDIETVSQIDGAVVLAFENEGEFQFYDEELIRLGLDAFEVRESLKNRLFHLSQLDKMVDVQM